MIWLGRFVVRQANVSAWTRSNRCQAFFHSVKSELNNNQINRLNITQNVSRKFKSSRSLSNSAFYSGYVNILPIGNAALGFSFLFKPKNLPNPIESLPVDRNKIEIIIKPKKPGLFRRIIRKIVSIVVYFARGFQLWVMFTPVVLFYPLLFWNDSLKKLWWKLFIFSTNNAGPICIKFAQWASTRRDIFSSEFCNHFTQLQRRTKPHSWKFTKFRLEQAFGKKWRDIIVKFDNNRQPVGSGCVAQVYKAYIKAQDIKDEELLNEMIEENQSDDFNFFEGAEVIGFGHIFGTTDSELDEAEAKRRQCRIDREIDRIITEHEQDQGSKDNQDCSNDELESYSKSLLEEKLSEIDQDSDDLDGLVPIAIKVLHPNIQSQFKRDLSIMKAFAKFIEFVIPNMRWLSLSECVDTFEKSMIGQLNLVHEAKCMDKFRENFQDIANVRFASPIWPFVTRHVLVQTYEDSEPLCTFMKEDEEHPEFLTSELKSKIAEIGLHALLKMIFEDSLVHGDLHPGNILIQNYEPYVGNDSGSEDHLVMLDICDTLIVKPKTEKYQRLRVLVLDCGITTSLAKEDLDQLSQLFSAVIRGKDKEVSDLFLKYSECGTSDEVEISNFRKGMKKIIQKSVKDRLTLDSTDVGELLSDVFSLLYKHKIKLENKFVSVILAVLVIEGVGRSLDPTIDIIEMARPYIL